MVASHARFRKTVAALLLAVPLAAAAADVSGRKMVWAHYVPWFTPGDASLTTLRVYDFPQTAVGADPLRDEIRRAMDQGIDGFFNDMVAHVGGTTSFWDLRPFLKAAEGTPFQFGICLDAKLPTDQQVRELVKMLSTYGDHPNYPRWGNAYVVDTYTYLAWTPEEWRQIREGCRKAGYPIHVMANIETGYKAYSDERLKPYAGLFEKAYVFSNNGIGQDVFKPLEQENAEAAAFCAANGAAFVPCLWPGYYGGWLSGRCSYYQPFLGNGTLLRRFRSALALGGDWLHVTTWNDHDETTLQTRRLATANPAIIRAMSRAFKGEAAAEREEVVFAYLRETLAGSPLRFEATCLPCENPRPVSIRGRVVDEKGAIVATFEPRTLSGAAWERAEWVLRTSSFASSHALTPEFTIEGGAGRRTVTLPPAFLAAGCLMNPETVKVSERDRRPMIGEYAVGWKDGVLTGTCAFESEAPLARAVLYCNERPVAAFARSRGTFLNVRFGGEGRLELQVRGGQVAQAVKSGETNGAPHFAWTPERVVSQMSPTWMRHAVRLSASPETRLTFSDNREKVEFSPAELVAAGVLRAGKGEVALSADATLYDQPGIGSRSGRLNLAVWARKPSPTDAFWVEYEFEDGTFAESRVSYPFAVSRKAIAMNVVETTVTLEDTSGASGNPDSRVTLTDALSPARTAVVAGRVSPFAVRRWSVDLEGEPMLRPKLPQRRWPMGPFRMAFSLTPLVRDGRAHPLLVRAGWNEGPEFRLEGDGRLLATYGGGEGDAAFSAEVRTREPLRSGKLALVTLVSDGKALRLYLNGEEQASAALPAVRVYGNCSPALGEGVNGEKATVAKVHAIAFTGDPGETLALERECRYAAGPTAPRTVAVPPTYAVRDMCRTADGSIRHYGWKNLDGKRRRVYVESSDEGENWRTCEAREGDVGAMVQSPWSGEWIYFDTDVENGHQTRLLRSKTGPGDTEPTVTPMPWKRLELRQLVALKSRPRWIAAFSDVNCEDGACYRPLLALSDDDGKTWRTVRIAPVRDVPRLHPGDRRPHWYNDGCEPTLVELGDGALLMAVRTSGEHHAFCRSEDGGETWTEGVESDAFWAANTMPYLFRLNDGRLMFFWNNTQMLPTRPTEETPELKDDPATLAGVWETVFTNRDALHAAISDDDGKTWRGFREIALNEARNASDFRELGYGEETDNSVHQTQAVELKDGNVLVAYGQNPAARRIAVVDPDWLLEKTRREDFRSGLGNVSNHLYLKSLNGGNAGWWGHCAWNRIAGATMARDPETDEGKGSVREVLQLCRIRDPRTVSDRQGVAWNFPASRRGRVEIACRIDGAGFLLTLSDRWINPCDETNPARSAVSTAVRGEDIGTGRWTTLAVSWDEEKGRAVVSAPGMPERTVEMKSRPRYGLSYLHLQTLAEDTDAKGTYFKEFTMRSE